MATTIVRTPMVDDDGTGTTGTVLNNAWKTQFYDQIDGMLPVPIDQPFNAAHYTADAPMTISVTAGQVLTNAYSVLGKQATWAFQLSGATLGGTPSGRVLITLPGGLVSSRQTFGAIASTVDGGGARPGRTQGVIGAGASVCSVQFVDGATFTLGSLYVYFTLQFFVQ